jgi:hypothetical protein
MSVKGGPVCAEMNAVAELALGLLEDGSDKDDLASIFREISTILLTCNNDMVRAELEKELK